MVNWNSWLEFVESVTAGTPHAMGYRVFRIGYGALLIAWVVGYLRVRAGLCGPLAIFDRPSFEKHQNRPWGMFDLFSDPVACTLAAALGLIAGGLLVGTRLPAGCLFPVIWVCLCSFQGRNPHFNYGGDDVFRLLAVAFLPDFSGSGVPRGVFAAQVLMLAVYWNTAISKWLESEWQTGEALYGFTRLTMIRRFEWLPRLTSPRIYRPLTYLSLVLETALPFLLFFEDTVVVGILLALLIHLGLQVFYRLHLFQAVMILGLSLFPTDAQYRAGLAVLKTMW